MKFTEYALHTKITLQGSCVSIPTKHKVAGEWCVARDMCTDCVLSSCQDKQLVLYRLLKVRL